MKELNELEIELLMMSAEALMDEGKVPEAKEVLIEVLCEDPMYANAHNYLGRIYTHVIVNLVKAEEHFKLALKYAEGFPAVFSNYAIFLLEANKLDELIAFVNAYENELGVDRALLLALKGNALEMKREYKAALKLYKEAKGMALNTEFIHNVNFHIDRINLKMSRLERVMAML